jgi:hypothetical protein
LTIAPLHNISDFLSQCLPRLEVLIEAGSTGVLGEELFELCLTLHDGILAALDDKQTNERETETGVIMTDLIC